MCVYYIVVRREVSCLYNSLETGKLFFEIILKLDINRLSTKFVLMQCMLYLCVLSQYVCENRIRWLHKRNYIILFLYDGRIPNNLLYMH